MTAFSHAGKSKEDRRHCQILKNSYCGLAFAQLIRDEDTNQEKKYIALSASLGNPGYDLLKRMVKSDSPPGIKRLLTPFPKQHYRTIAEMVGKTRAPEGKRHQGKYKNTDKKGVAISMDTVHMPKRELRNNRHLESNYKTCEKEWGRGSDVKKVNRRFPNFALRKKPGLFPCSPFASLGVGRSQHRTLLFKPSPSS